MARAFGKEPLFFREGGSGPERALSDALGAACVYLGVMLPSDRIHAPNERLLLANYYRGCGRPPTPSRSSPPEVATALRPGRLAGHGGRAPARRPHPAPRVRHRRAERPVRHRRRDRQQPRPPRPGADPLVAVGTTLPSILPGAISGTLRYRREGLIDWRLVTPAAAAGLLAVVGGSLLSHAVPGEGHLLLLLIAVLLAFTAWRTAVTAPTPADGPDHGGSGGGADGVVGGRGGGQDRSRGR